MHKNAALGIKNDALIFVSAGCNYFAYGNFVQHQVTERTRMNKIKHDQLWGVGCLMR